MSRRIRGVGLSGGYTTRAETPWRRGTLGTRHASRLISSDESANRQGIVAEMLLSKSRGSFDAVPSLVPAQFLPLLGRTLLAYVSLLPASAYPYPHWGAPTNGMDSQTIGSDDHSSCTTRLHDTLTRLRGFWDPGWGHVEVLVLFVIHLGEP